MNYLIVIVLVGLAGIFAGLTLAMFSLDLSDLERKIKLGDTRAEKVYPLRKKGNLLLCTLLLGNVASYTSMAIFLGSITQGVIAGFIATALIFVFGEILPQAIFPRYALEIGSRTAGLVKGAMVLFYPIAAPLAWLLDLALGKEFPTIWSKGEIKELIRYHKHVPEAEIDHDEARIVLGALSFSDKKVTDVMVPRPEVFCLWAGRKITPSLLTEIREKNFSRIPVIEDALGEVVGIFYPARLLGRDDLEGRTVAELCERENLVLVSPGISLDRLLNEFVSRKIQIAVILGETQGWIGVVTLEDILEEILRVEIEE